MDNPVDMTTPLEIFAKRLRELRRELHLRQEDVAAELKVSRQTISKYERGAREPDYYMLNRLADYYEVSIDYLFGRSRVKQLLYPSHSPKADSISQVAEQADWQK